MTNTRKVPQDRLRLQLAQEAARLIHEHGITDYRLAKIKAAERLNCSGRVRLPGNREIEAAIAAHNRIFAGDRHAERLASLRSAAIRIMQILEHFCPFLVGEVLSGHVTDHSAIKLHVFCDAPVSVAAELDGNGIDCSSVATRQRIRRTELIDFPGLELYAEEFRVTITVFPERMRRNAPLCPISGGPMPRASLAAVSSLAAD